MESNDNTSRALTQIAAILQVAYEDEIKQTRAELMKDKANKAILTATASWAETGAIEKAVVGSKAASRSTFYTRLNDLADRGLLERRKAGNTTEYRSTGLI
jgi:hypothetical protein